jgi:Protein of unknown function (DUF1631)
MSTKYVVSADFRDDPHLVGLLRQAISGVGSALPEIDEELYRDLLKRYRELAGERSGDTVYSYAKSQLDKHFTQFRAQYPKILSEYLMAQLDSAQGRKSSWPAMDGEAPDLVTDEVMQRRMVIDELTRVVDLDAEEGVRAFDALLSQALGCTFKTLRDNPMRPAVFFHALGLSWVKASGEARDELFMLSQYAPILGSRIAKVYPALTATLRAALNVPKPGALNMLGAGADGKLYERLKSQSEIVGEAPQGGAAHAAAASAPASVPASAPASASGPARQADVSVARTESAENTTFGGPQVLAALDSIAKRIEPAILDDHTPHKIALMLSRIQNASTRRALVDPSLAQGRTHPIWKLLQALGDRELWPSIRPNAPQFVPLVMHLSVIRELLLRDPSARASASAQDGQIFEYLLTQFLHLSEACAMPAERSVAATPEVASPEAAKQDAVAH